MVTQGGLWLVSNALIPSFKHIFGLRITQQYAMIGIHTEGMKPLIEMSQV